MIAVLSIAGSDSGGGAGIQADLKTFSAHFVYGMTALTAITAQNTRGVQAVQTVDPAIVAAQIDSVFDDFAVAAVKVGMLPNPGVMEVVAARLVHHQPRWVVVDPVMVAKGGSPLMDADAIDAFRRFIVPLADLITPNLPETEALTGSLPSTHDEMAAAGQDLRAFGAGAALIKGGHLQGAPDDVLCTSQRVTIFEGQRQESRHTHGTGCSLSSAIAAFLARGESLEAAVRQAKAYVAEGIRLGPDLGHGTGPIHHFWNLWPREAL